MHFSRNAFIVLPLFFLIGAAKPTVLPHILSTQSGSSTPRISIDLIDIQATPQSSTTSTVFRYAGSKRSVNPLDYLDYGLRIAGLPKGWTGVYTTFKSTRPTIPITSVFIRFYKQAFNVCVSQNVPKRYTQRFEFGVLVLELMSTDASFLVTKELMAAVSLWLMDQAQRGWTGLFEAFLKDATDGEMVYLRVATIWDLPGKVSNSPWD